MGRDASFRLRRRGVAYSSVTYFFAPCIMVPEATRSMLTPVQIKKVGACVRPFQ